METIEYENKYRIEAVDNGYIVEDDREDLTNAVICGYLGKDLLDYLNESIKQDIISFHEEGIHSAFEITINIKSKEPRFK